MGAIINPLSTEAADGGEKDQPLTITSIYLQQLYILSDLIGGGSQVGVVGWGIAISDSLIGRCLELSGVRTVNPSGNTSWLT